MQLANPVNSLFLGFPSATTTGSGSSSLIGKEGATGSFVILIFGFASAFALDFALTTGFTSSMTASIAASSAGPSLTTSSISSRVVRRLTFLT